MASLGEDAICSDERACSSIFLSRDLGRVAVMCRPGFFGTGQKPRPRAGDLVIFRSNSANPEEIST